MLNPNFCKGSAKLGHFWNLVEHNVEKLLHGVEESIDGFQSLVMNAVASALLVS